MKRIIIPLLVLFLGWLPTEAQTIAQIRQAYADAKQLIAENGKNGMAPLDVKMTLSGGSELGDDDFIDEVSELTFYFNKYRIDSTLDYPDASSCYFVTVSWASHGHTNYREVLFDPNEGYLLFSYMRGETDAGFVVESRYYYGADGRLIDQKHRVGGQEATADAHSWTTPEGDKELAGKYLAIFETLMNQKNPSSASSAASQGVKGNPARMKYIRETYAKAKAKIGENDKSAIPHDLQIVVRDQTSGPPEVTDLKFYYEPGVDDPASNKCYFVSERHHNNNMGLDVYSEYLFKPQSRSLIFSYCRAAEEGETFEWRYYFDAEGHCIEAKTNADEHDNGHADKLTAKRYQDLFFMVCDAAVP